MFTYVIYLFFINPIYILFNIQILECTKKCSKPNTIIIYADPILYALRVRVPVPLSSSITNPTIAFTSG